MILPLFTGATLIVPALLYAYKRIRPLFSVSVNCWFCGAQTVVPYGNFNCWDCPSCEQYNGFKEDGDYNKPIPAQHDERLNFTAPASCQSDSSPLKMKTSNQLCSACNYHQLVKIRLLANFTPTEEGQFEAEAEEYRRHLEEVYALCPSCDVQVKRTLLLQDSLLRPHLVGHPALTRWQVLARYSLPWTQRLRLTLSVAASAASLYMSLTLLVAALGSEATLARFAARLGLDRIGAPPLRLLQPAGFVLAGSSVLLSGRQRLGPVALLLCLLWLLSLSCSHLAAFCDPVHSAWPQALLLGATAVVGTAHLLALAKAQLHGGAVRKLVGSSGSSSLASSPCPSGGASPSWSDSAGTDVRCSDTRSSCSQRTAASSDRPLPDMMSDVHISPESERSWSTSTWSKPTSLQGSSRGEVLGAGGDRKVCTGSAGPPSLVWPPRLRLPRSGPPGSSWVAAGAWAVGSQRTSSNTQLLWGVKQSFGLLTPPPSLNGSAKHSDSSAVSAAGQRHNTDWCFFRQRDAFFSSSPNFASGSNWRATGASSGVPSPRSRGLVQRAPTHQGDSQASPRGYARSSVSQASSLVEPRDDPVTTGPAEPHRWLPSPTLGWLLLGISVLLNLSLFVYLAAWS